MKTRWPAFQLTIHTQITITIVICLLIGIFASARLESLVQRDYRVTNLDAVSSRVSTLASVLALASPSERNAIIGIVNRVYGPMKAGVEALTRYMAVELRPRGISANVVAPGAIATNFSGAMVRDNPEVNKAAASHTALGRVGLPQDVGTVIAGLLSDEFG